MRILFTISLIISIAACSGYGGGHKIVGKSKQTDTSNYVKITSAKGLSIQYNPKDVYNPKTTAIKNFIKPGLYKSLSLPPGEHTLILVYKAKNRKHTKRVNIVLKPNTNYKADYLTTTFSVKFWITNLNTGKVVVRELK